MLTYTYKILLLLVFSLSLKAEELSLESIFDIELEVATRTRQSIKLAPNVVTVITKEDIKNAQANDLIDILQMVPGFNLAKDLDDPALMVRGLYGFEGRSLIMLNGMQISGLYFGSFTFGNRIPATIIERVEVIRGPGSVVYGGIAELATVNIITVPQEDIGNSKRLDTRLSVLGDKFSQKDFGFSYQYKTNSWRNQGNIFIGEGLRSSKDFPLFELREPVDHNRDSALTQNILWFGSMKSQSNWEIKYAFNRYYDHFLKEFTDVSDRDAYSDKAMHEFINLDLSKKMNLSDTHILTPSISVQRSRDWEQGGRTDPIISRYKLQSLFVKNFSSQELSYGFEYFVDHGSLAKDVNDAAPQSRGFSKEKGAALSDSVDVVNYALFFNSSFLAWDSNFSLGARYDNNEIFGNALSPRLALTKLNGPRYYKFLYSEAFRAPLMGNNAYSKYGLNPNASFREEVKPEKSRVVEFEMGYQLNENWALSYNIFDQNIKDVIEFYYCSSCDEPDSSAVDTDGDLYSKNGDSIGTRGLEAVLKFDNKRISSNLNFSYFKLIEKGAITYLTPGDKKELMGAPNFKIYNNNSFRWKDQWMFQFGFVFLSSKNSMQVKYSTGSDDNSATKKRGQEFLVNCGLSYQWSDDIDIRFNIHDLFNQSLRLVTPYVDNERDDFSYKGREALLQLSYNF